MTNSLASGRERAIAALPLCAVLLLAASLRFTSLDARGFWRDEAATVELVRKGFWGMLTAVPGSEGTPPVYYILAWVWTHVFGSNEAGLRSFSALIGTATVVVVYAIGRELGSPRVGLVAALLAAVNPFLVWHAQDGRAYALYTLLGALSFLTFARAVRSPSARALAIWALVSALALWTHYFAAFLIAPEAAVLVLLTRPRMRALVAAGAVATAGLAALPLAFAQRGSARVSWIAEIPYSDRLREVTREFLTGPQAPSERLLIAVTSACIVVGMWAVIRRTDDDARRSAVLAGAIGFAAFALALGISAAGFDYFLSRNIVVAWIPLAVALAVGLGAPRAGFPARAALAVLTVTGSAIVVATAHDPKFGSEDWRGASRALGDPASDRAIVLWLGVGEQAFRLYRSALPLPPTGSPAREVAVVFVGVAEADVERRRGDLSPPAPFRQVDEVEGDHYTILRFRAPEPQDVQRSTLVSGPAGYSAAVLVETP